MEDVQVTTTGLKQSRTARISVVDQAWKNQHLRAQVRDCNYLLCMYFKFLIVSVLFVYKYISLCEFCCTVVFTSSVLPAIHGLMFNKDEFPMMFSNDIVIAICLMKC